jgi:trehalose 6-phosphate synthase/phosphatase
MGDDRTDEDIFAMVPPEQWTVKVGPGLSVARFTLPTPTEVLALLRDLVKASG